jgi:hypothetical protein
MAKWTMNDLKNKGMARVNGIYKKIGIPKVKKLPQDKIDEVLETLRKKGLDKLR